MRITLRIAPLILVALAFLTGCSGDGGEESNAMKASDFNLPAVGNDQTISLADYEGKVLLLDFWATWCPPCKREIPHFNELYETYKGEGLEVLGVSLDQGGASVVSKYMESSAPSLVPSYPVAMADASVQTSYGPIESIPTTFIIDRKGNVQQRIVGYREKEFFETAVKALL